MDLIESLIVRGCLRTPSIIEAFRNIKRVDFLPKDIKHLAELDEALSIGEGQTISQPQVVAFMLELLAPEPGNKILDIGAGSGWTSALLAYIVTRKGLTSKTNGRVIALEIIPSLAEFGKQNVSRYNFVEKGIVDFRCADGSKGCQEEAPFDRILCSAEAKEISQEWKEQLRVGGRLVSPVGSSIWLLRKESVKDFEFTEYPGFVFVPLIQS